MNKVINLSKHERCDHLITHCAGGGEGSPATCQLGHDIIELTDNGKYFTTIKLFWISDLGWEGYVRFVNRYQEYFRILSSKLR